MTTGRRRTVRAGALLLAAILIAVFWGQRDPSRASQTMAGPSSTPALSAEAVAPAPRALKSGPLAAGFEDATRREFERVSAAAEGGDVHAQRRLAELYEKCFLVNLRRASYLDGVESAARVHLDPDAAQQMRLTGERVFAQCGGVDGGQVIPLDAMLAWREQAARQGDLASQLWLRLRQTATAPLMPAEYGQLMEQVIAGDDATAMAYLGALAQGTAATGAAGGDPLITGLAWQITACQRGLACGVGSELMDALCFNTGACTETDGTVVLRLMAAEQQAALDAEIALLSTQLGRRPGRQ